MFVLELLQWKAIDKGEALLPTLAGLLKAKIDAAERRAAAQGLEPQVGVRPICLLCIGSVSDAACQ